MQMLFIIFFIVFLAGAVIGGWRRGFLSELIRLSRLVLALITAGTVDNVPWPAAFVIAWVLFGLLARMLRAVCRVPVLGPVNRFFGALLGCVVGVLGAAALTALVAAALALLGFPAYAALLTQSLAGLAGLWGLYGIR